jgi:hypothetical protein
LFAGVVLQFRVHFGPSGSSLWLRPSRLAEKDTMLTAGQVLNNYFLETRCQLLELAATLDRYDRAANGTPAGAPEDPRLQKIYQSLALLADGNATPDRAERLLNLFSD